MENTKFFHGRPSTHFLRQGKFSKRPRPPAADKEEVQDMANCLMLLSRGRDHRQSFTGDDQVYQTVDRGSSLYRCKTCDKVFPSFQALGGHRARHRKPGKTALSDFPNPNPSSTSSPRQGHGPTNKVHECSICGSEFGSGQALGGHMRRHRPGNADVESNKKGRSNVLGLDLNLPAPEDSDSGDCLYGLGFALSGTPLMDCRY